MSKKQGGPPKRLGQYRMSADLVRQVAQEALDHGLWPTHVVERRLRHSYAASPDLPSGSPHRKREPALSI